MGREEGGGFRMGNTCIPVSKKKKKKNNLPANAGDPRGWGSILRSGRSPGEGHGNPLQYSCLRIPWIEEPGGLQSMGSQSRTLSDQHFTSLSTLLVYYS